jgi:hypothetical protein
MCYDLKGTLIFCYLYSFLSFSINRMLCLLFSKKKKNGEKSIVRKHLKHIQKKTSTLKYSNPSLIKEFKRSLTDSSCGLSLKAEYLDNLWFGIIQPETNINS